MRALSLTISRRDIEVGLVVHSDRYIQFRSVRYQDLIISVSAVFSMCRRSTRWDIENINSIVAGSNDLARAGIKMLFVI